ncbi:uncharacterized protein LOC127256847 [Andrographis paniculata]|uniref:uncharacterized protein LOC127256847 n=1 Tax=Andrographis paniculata TaxID=175694 RepID=UPI0021E90CB5|nr:uncharacterized protein LOC127256847 [Andrographis paniculata]
MSTIITPIQFLSFKPKSPFSVNPKLPPFNLNFNFNLNFYRPLIAIRCCCVSNQEIDMVRTKEGSYAAKPKKVVVLWDLDNKPPRGPPYEAAQALKSVAQRFGDVIDISAYANRHAFVHLPQWVVEERRERRHLDALERRGLAPPAPAPYVCSVCGRKCKTHVDLKKHFRQLHERERQKKLGRMRSLKGKKRQRFKERYIDGNERYNEAARRLLTPKVGYGLAQELRRAGVYVKTVEDKPQAADWALKRQMAHSMSRGVDWIVLVSDDSDFLEMLRKARSANLGTVVVGDRDGVLGRHADVWVPWTGVENGEIKEDDLELKRREFDDDDAEENGNGNGYGYGYGGAFSVSEFGGEFEVESFADDDGGSIGAVGLNGFRVSSTFSEGEGEDSDLDEVQDYGDENEDDENDVYF